MVDEDERTMHLMLDGKCSNANVLSSVEALTRVLRNVVALIGMKMISEPFIVDYPAGNGYDRGLSGCIFLAESSITIHTYPERGFAFIDVFSCKGFDVEQTKKVLCEKFGLEPDRCISIPRGLHG